MTGLEGRGAGAEVMGIVRGGCGGGGRGRGRGGRRGGGEDLEEGAAGVAEGDSGGGAKDSGRGGMRVKRGMDLEGGNEGWAHRGGEQRGWGVGGHDGLRGMGEGRRRRGVDGSRMTQWESLRLYTVITCRSEVVCRASWDVTAGSDGRTGGREDCGIHRGVVTGGGWGMGEQDIRWWEGDSLRTSTEPSAWSHGSSVQSSPPVD